MKQWNVKHDWVDVSKEKSGYFISKITSICKGCGMERIQTSSGSNWNYKYYINNIQQYNSMNCNSVKQEKRNSILEKLGI